MDRILDLCDIHFFTPFVYPAGTWTEGNIYRQFVSLALILTVGGYVTYITTATLSYFFVFDHRVRHHPLFQKNQEWKEIKLALTNVPIMSCLAALIFLPEVRGHSKLHHSFEKSFLGIANIIISILGFIIFTDSLNYWIHRGLHHPRIYKYLHKTHHSFKIPTPFASHAFNAVDAFIQGTPYHLYVFVFPMNQYVFLGLFVLVNMWTVSIHDGDDWVPRFLNGSVHGTAHHTDHHLFYNYNYGQFLTLWDWMGGTLRHPSSCEGKSPLDFVIKKGLASKAK